MSARIRHRPVGLCALLTWASLSGLSLTGCGDDEVAAVTQRGLPGGGPAPAPAARRVVAAAAAGEVDESRLPAKLRGLKAEDWEIEGDLPVLLREGRDPFLPYVSDLIAIKTDVHQEEDDPKLDIRVKVSDDVRTLQLIAVLSGSGTPQAMLKDSSGLGHVLIPGDVVGAEMPYRVARITRNEVLFQPLQVSEGENQPAEISKVLLTQQELEDFLP